VYTAALAVVWPLTIRAVLATPAGGNLHTVRALFTAVCTVAAASNLRLNLLLPKYGTWAIALPTGVLASAVVPDQWKKLAMLAGEKAGL